MRHRTAECIYYFYKKSTQKYFIPAKFPYNSHEKKILIKITGGHDHPVEVPIWWDLIELIETERRETMNWLFCYTDLSYAKKSLKIRAYCCDVVTHVSPLTALTIGLLNNRFCGAIDTMAAIIKRTYQP
jgi:hypothetical protein